MRKLLWILLLIVPCAARAQCNIAAGSSISTIQSAISSAASNSCGGSIHNEALFAQGTSNVAWNSGGTAINIPCPTGAGLIITGPTTNYMKNGVQGAWAANNGSNGGGTLAGALPQATIRNTNTGGEAYQLFSWPGGCTNPITFTYLEVDGNHPASGGGAIDVGYSTGGPGSPTSNGTIEYNWFHGNQSQAQQVVGLCNVSGGQDFAANEIYFEGTNGGAANNGSYHTNFTIDYNIFGNGSTANPTAGDCGNIMQWEGVCTGSGTCPGQSFDSCNFVGYDTIGGQCAALGVHSNTTNFHFDYNKIIQEEQGTKWYEGGSPFNGDGAYSLFFQTNDTMNNNDIGTYHRIGTEDQQSSQTYSPLQGTCSLDAEGDCMTHLRNDMHDNYVPGFGGWGFSIANTGYRDDSQNLMISNNSNASGGAGPGDFEDFSTYFGVNNNFSQGYVACSVQFGGNNTSESASSVSNNIFQNPNGGSCTIQFSINNSHGGVPAFANNNSGTTNCCSTIQSAAPSFSPNGGTFSGSVTVTLTDNGTTSSQGPQGNTNLWCTTDGSTPVPHSGTSIFYASGSTPAFTVSTTLKCVGMWGSQNQPAPKEYPSGGFGYTASPVVSAFYQLSGSSTPTLTGIALSLTGNSLTVGQSAQVTATCSYSNGTSDACNNTDAFGNVASNWTSSSTSAATVNSTGTLTAVAAGSTNVTAKAGSFTSAPLAVTVTAAAPTLTGVTIADGGVGTVTIGQTVQASATAVYNSGALTTNCSATADQYGTTCGTWTSSTPGNASVSNSGLITGVAVSTTGVTVKATNGATSFTSSPLAITVTSNAPPAATLTGVTASCGSSSIPAGSTISCAATCAYSDSSTTNCTSTDAHGNSVIGNWLSSNTTIATINASTGVVTAVSAGSTSSTVDTSLTGWSTCVIGNCSAGGSPGGSGTPTAYSQTINNSSPAGAPFGTSMLLSQTANTSNTNALWTFKAPSTCDTCTTLASTFSVYLGTNSAQASAFEFDNFNFSVAAGKNYMAGHQYNQVTGKWQVFNGATGSWVDTSVTNFIANASWHSIAFSDSVTTCSGAAGIQFNSVTIDGVVYAINLCEPVAALPSNYTSAVGTQFQIDIGTITGSQTVTENIAAVNFTAGGSTAALPAVTNITAKAGAFLSPVFPLTVTPSISGNILGQAIFDTAGATYPNALVATYAISPATPSNVSYLNFYIAPLSPPALVAGNQYDVILTMAPTATTQSATATCTATYTTLGTTADYGWHQLSPNGTGCGSIPGNTGYWVGTVIKNAGPEGLGFYDCGSATNGCNGGAPTGPGPGTYHFWIASVNYGQYSSMTTTMVNPVQPGAVALQASAYATLTSPTPTLIGGFLTNPPSSNFLFTGQTLQFTAFCVYSDGTKTSCSSGPDIWGNMVLTWQSSNTAAVTIGAVGSTHPGLATAVGPGVSNITAMLGGGANAAIEVTVGGSFGQ